MSCFSLDRKSGNCRLVASSFLRAAQRIALIQHAGESVVLAERLAEVGEDAVIRPPFHCDYGFNILLGAGAFLNFNCMILDFVRVAIGDKT
jgi:maltose O-acetyltransferase